MNLKSNITPIFLAWDALLTAARAMWTDPKLSLPKFCVEPKIRYSDLSPFNLRKSLLIHFDVSSSHFSIRSRVQFREYVTGSRVMYGWVSSRRGDTLTMFSRNNSKRYCVETEKLWSLQEPNLVVLHTLTLPLVTMYHLWWCTALYY